MFALRKYAKTVGATCTTNTRRQVLNSAASSLLFSPKLRITEHQKQQSQRQPRSTTVLAARSFNSCAQKCGLFGSSKFSSSSSSDEAEPLISTPHVPTPQNPVPPHIVHEILKFDKSAAAGIHSAHTPPSTWYTNPEFFGFEMHVLRQHWMPVGRTDQVAKPGQFFSGELFGEPFIIVRDNDNKLRAFYNVCQHHASQLIDGAGKVDHFVCPYHGWTYRLDGRLTKATRLKGIQDFVARDVGLVPLAGVMTWGPLVFVRLGNPKPTSVLDAQALQGLMPLPVRDIEEDLAILAEKLAELDADSMEFVGARQFDVEANWKVVVDNYLDGGYHVEYMHRQLGEQLDLETYSTELFERFSIQTADASAMIKQLEEEEKAQQQEGEEEDGEGKANNNNNDTKKSKSSIAEDGTFVRDDEDDEAEGEQRKEAVNRVGAKALYSYVYPNWMINCYSNTMDINIVLPISPTHTRIIYYYYFRETEGKAAKKFIKTSIQESSLVQQEDTVICESVQRGLESSGFSTGRYAPEVEACAYHFHKLLFNDLISVANIKK